MSDVSIAKVVFQALTNLSRIFHCIQFSIGFVIGLVVYFLYDVWWPLVLAILLSGVSFKLSKLFISAVHSSLLEFEYQVEMAARLQRLAEIVDGESEPSPELDEMFRKAGLQLMTVPTQFGPVIGTLDGNDIFEWVDCKFGTTEEVFRYFYEGKAEMDDNNCLVIPNTEKQYVAFDGVLYSRT